LSVVVAGTGLAHSERLGGLFGLSNFSMGQFSAAVEQQWLFGAAACHHGAEYLLLSDLPHRPMNSRPTRGGSVNQHGADRLSRDNQGLWLAL
jgi:hypothetical protein